MEGENLGDCPSIFEHEELRFVLQPSQKVSGRSELATFLWKNELLIHVEFRHRPRQSFVAYVSSSRNSGYRFETDDHEPALRNGFPTGVSIYGLADVSDHGEVSEDGVIKGIELASGSGATVNEAIESLLKFISERVLHVWEGQGERRDVVFDTIE